MHNGRTRHAPLLWFLSLLALALSAAPEAGEQRYFRDWLASCNDDTPSSCHASSFQLREGGPEYDHALRLEREAPGTQISLVLESTTAALDAQTPVDIQVDNQPATTIFADGYHLDPGAKVLTVTAGETINTLIPRLRAGNRVFITFTRADGQPGSVSFSLLGLTAALNFMQAEQEEVPSLASAPLPRNYRCLGQEPFWNLAISGDQARYAELGDEGEGRELLGQTRSMAYVAVPTFAWRGRSADDAADLIAFITRERCQDTMADRPPYAYTARISLPNGDTRYGCCSAQAASPAKKVRSVESGLPVARLEDKPAQDWSNRLLKLMPAIRLCLERSPRDARTVITAWNLDDGLVGVRLIGEGSRRYECLVDPQVARIARFEPLSPDSPTLPGEGMPLFRPASGEPPAPDCYDREQVIAKDGSLLGYLGYQTCFRAPRESPQRAAPSGNVD
jgi:uncharacterized membrane protein/invasion protein IalB